jgi:hypothetical protein
LYEVNGKLFDGMIYNFLWSAFPEGGSSVPDVTWFLQWADTTLQHVIGNTNVNLLTLVNPQSTATPTPNANADVNTTL